MNEQLVFRRQEVLAKSLTDALFYGNLQGLAEGFQKLPSNKNLDVFKVRPSYTQQRNRIENSKGDTDAKKNVVALVAAVIIPLHSEVRIRALFVFKRLNRYALGDGTGSRP